MIVPIIGNVTYSITLDPTVWIFDDRKMILEEAFTANHHVQQKEDAEQAAKRWEQAVNHQHIKPPVNRSLSRHERENILNYSYVMPINDFLNHAEIRSEAKQAVLVTDNGNVEIPISKLKESYFLFALNGKPLTKDGPVHLLYKDGSNRENPIKGIKKIVIE